MINIVKAVVLAPHVVDGETDYCWILTTHMRLPEQSFAF